MCWVVAAIDTPLRNLDQIEESSEGPRPDRVMIAWGVALLSVVAIVIAIAASVGTPPGTAQELPDPLSNLAVAPTQAKGNESATQEVDPKTLTFPTALARQEPPEVAQMIAEADAEFAYPDPLVEPPTIADLAAELPAAVVAIPDKDVVTQAAANDPLVNHAPSRTAPSPSAAGTRGAFVLQVVSYTSPDQARSFADALKKRGHAAYVESAHVEERGQQWRVRIGPFASRTEANAYRLKFEKQEGINTFIIDRAR